MSGNIKHTVLVTGATGNQGSEVARHLLQASDEINTRCLVRNPNNDVAKALQAAGAKLFQGDFDDIDSLNQALDGCQTVYINTMPGPNSIEVQHAQNILSTAKTQGVKQVVCSTVTRASEHEQFSILKQVPEDHFMHGYWQDKAAIENLVKQFQADDDDDSGPNGEDTITSWTVIEPAWLMSNFVAPNAFAYWSGRLHGGDGGGEKKEEQGVSVLETAFGKDNKVQLVSGNDIGACATAAILEFARRHRRLTGTTTDAKTNEIGNNDNGLYDRKVIRLASDELTIEEIAATMSDVVGGGDGRRIKVEYLSPQQVDVEILKNPFLFSQRWATMDGTQVDMKKVEALKLDLLDFRAFLKRNREALIEAVTPTRTD